jgi:hypothetical protein
MRCSSCLARLAASTAVVLGALTAAGVAQAAPSPSPAPEPSSTSSTDEITDMVMGAIAHPATPTTTLVPAPPG